MTNEATVREIAGKLTKAEREFMLSPFYTAHNHGIAFAWFHDAGWWAGRKLARLGLVERRRIEPGYFASIPNDLGLAIRAHLLTQEPTP